MRASSGAGEEGQMKYALFDRGRIVICRSGNLVPTSSQSVDTVIQSRNSTCHPPLSTFYSSFLIMSINKACVGSTNPAVLYRRISYYRDLRIGRLHGDSEAQIYQTLAQSTHLARRVRSLEIRRNSDDPNIPKIHRALQNMINLRRVSLRHYYDLNLLVGCTFTLV
jgi:hypothetical protein